MSGTFRIVVPTILVIAMIGCGGSGTPASSGPAACEMAPTPKSLVGTSLASVNGHEVGSVGWEGFSARKSPANGAEWTLEEKQEILDEAIADELLLQEAFNRGVYQDPKVRKIMSNLLLRAEVYDKVRNEDFTEEEMRAYFKEHKRDFTVPEKVQIKRIFVSIDEDRPQADAKTLADALYTKVSTTPDTFRDVAVESSDGPFARRGGDVGYVDREGKPGLPPEVVARAFLLAEGAFSEPFEAAGGYNILYVPQRRERIERDFEQMRGAVVRRLKHAKYESLTDTFIADLKAKGEVTVNSAALTGFNPKAASKPGLNIPPVPVAPPKPEEPTIGVDEDGNEVEMVHGFPKTGDPIKDQGDANDEAIKIFNQEDE